MGMGIKGISSAFHISRNTVRKYVRRFLESGMTLDKLMSMSEEHLQEMFCDAPIRERKMSSMREELEALLPEYAKRLSHKGVMMKDIYDEYAKSHPNGYKRSHFGTLLRRYMY